MVLSCEDARCSHKEGNLVDVYLSDKRDQEAAEAFFTQAAKTSGVYPENITTDKEPALYCAIENTFGDYTDHRDSKFKNNVLEQDHRGPKSRIHVMKGFKNILSQRVFAWNCTILSRMKNITN